MFLNNEGEVQIEGWFNAHLIHHVAGSLTRAFRFQSIEKTLGATCLNPLKSDVWSLGLIYLELLLGEPVFSNSRSLKQHVETLFTIFGGAMSRFESLLKNKGLWPGDGFISKHGRSSLEGFLFKRLPRYGELTPDSINTRKSSYLGVWTSTLILVSQ